MVNKDELMTNVAPFTLALLRIVAGLLFLEHGLIKLANFPPGLPPGQIPFDAVLHWSLPGAQLWIGAVIETVSGVLLILGLFTRLAALVASGEMAVAYWQFHFPQGPFPAGNNGEAAVLFCFIFLYLVFAGPGALSVDGPGLKK
jgi:putative oxidoreductase